MEHGSGNTDIRQALDIAAHCIVLTAFLSVVRSISPLSSTIFVLAYISASYISSKKVFNINRAILNTAALLMSILVVSQASLENLGIPIVNLLFLFIVIKALEQKMFRDNMQIYALSVLLLAASSLLALDMIFAAYFIVMLFLISIGALLLAYFSHDSDMKIKTSVLKKIVTRSLLIPAIALPLTAVMFVILPRTPIPLWGFLTKQSVAYSGFSDKVELGSVSSIQESKAVILRVKTGRIPHDQLYWRGIVLDSFDGKRWSASELMSRTAAPEPPAARHIFQSIFLEPYGNKYLFALDSPFGYSAKGVKYFTGYVAALPDAPRSRIRYDAVSFPLKELGDEELDPAPYLALPYKGLERTTALTRQLTKNADAYEAALRILSHFESAFSYSLTSLPVSDNPVEEFLFNTKKGNCEYFASSMAVMLRIAGIPARVVGGYRGGEYNEIGGYYLVTQNEAHVWVEAHIGKKGWVRFDPTPSYPDGQGPSTRKGLFDRLRLIADAASYFWNSSVIPYDISGQFALFDRLKRGLSKSDILRLSTSPVFITGLAAIAVALLFFVIRSEIRRRKKMPYSGFISSFEAIMTKKGYIRYNGEGLQEFVSRIQETGLRECAGNFITEFQRLYYKDIQPDTGNRKNLKNLLHLLNNCHEDKTA